jgi:hypothetical protein
MCILLRDWGGVLRHWNIHAVLALAMVHIMPAVGQTTESAAIHHDDIVVVGRDERDRDKQIHNFVRGLTVTPGTDPLGRFDREEVCPQAAGLPPQYNRAIADRIRQVATAARISLAKEDCRYPNALVIFASNKLAMIAALRKRYPWLFHDMRGAPITIEREDGPAAAWHVEGLATRDGTVVPPGDPPQIRTTMASSRLQARARPVFLLSIVVIERRGVDGLTATQIADYAAMRTFTDATPARARTTAVSSILTVLDAPMGTPTPPTMTSWDLNFLRGYYDASPNSFARAQRGEIESYLKRHLDVPEKGTK